MAATEQEMAARGIRFVKVDPPQRCQVLVDGQWRRTLLSQWRRNEDGTWTGYIWGPGTGLPTSIWCYQPAERLRPMPGG